MTHEAYPGVEQLSRRSRSAGFLARIASPFRRSTPQERLANHRAQLEESIANLNDENDPPSLWGLPGITTRREYAQYLIDQIDSGYIKNVQKDRGFGSRPVGDNGQIIAAPSSPAPLNVEGAPIVDAARGLYARRNGEIPLSSGPATEQGRELRRRALAAVQQKREQTVAQEAPTETATPDEGRLALPYDVELQLRDPSIIDNTSHLL